MIESAIVATTSGLEHLAEEWGALAGRARTESLFRGPEWLLPWWRLFGEAEGFELRAVTVREGRRLVGFAPLFRRSKRHRSGLFLSTVELVGTGEPEADEIATDYVGAIAEAGLETKVADAVAHVLATPAFGPWDVLEFTAMNGTERLPHAIAAALEARGFVVRSEVSSLSHTIVLPSTWDAYLRALPSARRYLVRRALRDLETWSEGHLVVEVAKTPSDVATGFAVLESLHSERWSAAGKRGVFASERFRAFHLAVLPKLFAAGALELVWAQARGEPIAALYNVVDRNRTCFYQGGRSLRLPPNLRPGLALHAHAIRRSIQAGRGEYDFLSGDSRYKRDLATDVRPLLSLRAARPSLRNLIASGADDLIATARAIRRERALKHSHRAQDPETP